MRENEQELEEDNFINIDGPKVKGRGGRRKGRVIKRMKKRM